VRLSGSYPEVFAVVRRHLGSEAEQELLSCLRDMTSTDKTVIKNTLGCLRRLQERLYITLSRADQSLVPVQFVSGEVNVVSCYKHLSGKGVVERYKIIDRFAELVYKVASDNGSHTPYANPKYPPTLYTVQAATFALLDLILWFGQIVTQK